MLKKLIALIVVTAFSFSNVAWAQETESTAPQPLAVAEVVAVDNVHAAFQSDEVIEFTKMDTGEHDTVTAGLASDTGLVVLGIVFIGALLFAAFY